MKYLLPKIILSIVLFFVLFSSAAYAQPAPTATPAPDVSSPISVAAPGTTPEPGQWVSDPTVTFVGKTASRSGDFLDWTLRNYDWACVTRNAQNVCDNTNNPIVAFWAIIRNIIYAMLVAVVLVAAFVMIITRGKSLTITRFIPRFILIIVLVTLSYALIQFIYQVTDIIQGFFLRSDGKLISTQDLIFIGFPYKTFVGLRRFGEVYDESAFITLLLVRLTAITYYVMTGVLIVRKIILWFFIILSPVFPLLLFFRPIRNTGKIWVGEFFRWLLYAPLFAIFLHGLVVLWKSKSGIPLAFDFSNVGTVIYPTAVNILIGGPGQKIFYISDTNANSVNLQDTFALYVVSLLMLWVVIILPFILLKIFLDAIGGISIQDNPALKRLWNRGGELATPRPPSPAAPTPGPLPQGAGRAMQIPFAATNSSRMVSENRNIQTITSNPVNTQILQLANLSVPKMRDIARFETSMTSKDTSRMQEVSRMKTSLSRIASPTTVSAPGERERYTEVRQQLLSEKQKGNVLAGNILNAASVSSLTQTFGQNTTNISNTSNISSRVSEQKGLSALSSGVKTSSLTPASIHLPAVNKVQQVSIEDYEEVRKMWQDTYQNAPPPGDLSGKKETREEWVKRDIDKINQAVTLLNSVDPVRTKEGMDMVSNILPFLMIGGFSKTEVVAYLKAKLEAAKSVLSGVNKKDEEEDTMLDTKKAAGTETKHMSTETQAELPTAAAGEEKVDELRRQGGV